MCARVWLSLVLSRLVALACLGECRSLPCTYAAPIRRDGFSLHMDASVSMLLPGSSCVSVVSAAAASVSSV